MSSAAARQLNPIETEGKTNTKPVLEVHNLRTYFHTQDGLVKAVDNLSFYVRAGEALAIVGESGCGKSVTALSIMRLVPQPPGDIASGRIMLEGTDLLGLSEDQMRRIRGHRIAMIFQDPMTSLNPVLTIGLQLMEPIQLHLGLSTDRARERAIESLGRVGIPEPARVLTMYPHQLSGGMRQRVMIAMALSCDPRLLIADEPTTALDVTIQAQIIDLVKRLRQELGSAIIWITHDLGVVAGLCDRVNVMYAGHLVEVAPVRELYRNPSHPYTLGLLRSVPRMDLGRKKKLVPIDGLPPDLIKLPPGCPFYPRCEYHVDRCNVERPELRSAGDHPEHRIACWVDVRSVATEKGSGSNSAPTAI